MVHFNSARRNLTLLAAAGALALCSPAPVGAQTATFKSGVDMVPLTVTVTDTSGKYVTGLTGRDFTVIEDGVEQPVSFFACGDVPVDVALVLDTSASMRADLPIVQSAASGLVRTLRPSDRGAVVEVKDTPGMPQPFTSDRALIERSIRALKTSGATALYDGLYVALKEFERERRAAVQVRRQVLVLLSDGLDTKSRLAFEDVLDLERRVGVNIYVIALRDGDEASLPRAMRESSTMEAEFTMGAVSRESGGRTFFPRSARELPGIYAAIAQELASQYDLAYSPVRPGGGGAFRRVAVRVPPQTNASARTRSGYYAPRTKAAE
jgi:Ca-activated chloride channel family protein